MRRHVWVLGVAVAGLVVAAGCGSGGKKPVPVKGTVTLDGKPVSLASVVFVPQKEGGIIAQGVTNHNGEFELTTYKPNDGVLPGDYSVTVTKVDEMPTVNVSDLPADMTPDQIMHKVVPRVMAKRAQQRLQPKKSGQIPEFYGAGKRSPLRCRVPVDGEANFTLVSGK
jgi:hypothetical protein